MKICVVVDPYIPTSYKTSNFKIPYWEKLEKEIADIRDVRVIEKRYRGLKRIRPQWIAAR